MQCVTFSSVSERFLPRSRYLPVFSLNGHPEKVQDFVWTSPDELMAGVADHNLSAAAHSEVVRRNK